jgi:hypothetical protein
MREIALGRLKFSTLSTNYLPLALFSNPLSMKELVEVVWKHAAFRVLAFISACVLIRIVLLVTLSRPPIKKRRYNEQCRIAVFLGSGGHTSEMVQLLAALPIDRYPNRTYIVTTSDRFSMEKALQFEKSISTSSTTSFDFIQLPRARHVHQKWLSTPLSVLIAFAVSTYHLVWLPLMNRTSKAQHEAIIMNGPGTCVPIVASVYLLRVSSSIGMILCTPLTDSVLLAVLQLRFSSTDIRRIVRKGVIS